MNLDFLLGQSSRLDLDDGIIRVEGNLMFL